MLITSTMDLNSVFAADTSLGSSKGANKTELAEIQQVIPFSNKITNNNNLQNKNTQTNTSTLKESIESAQVQKFIPFLNDQLGDGSNSHKNESITTENISKFTKLDDFFDEDLDAKPNLPERYEVRVDLNSLTIHDDHDPWPKGKGEIINYAYVQGHLIDLSGHIDSGYTVFYDPALEAKVYLGITDPLSIFTVGIETDTCTSGSSINYSPPEYVKEGAIFFRYPETPWGEVTYDTQNDLLRDYLAPRGCHWDRLGTINEFYVPSSNYQSGIPQSVKSSNGDFTLRFTIHATRIQP